MTEVTAELLESALQRGGCAVCSILSGIVFDELCQLQQLAVIDPATHADVLARGGYCAEHFWSLDRLASAVTNAALLAPLMRRLREHVAALRAELAAGSAVLRRDRAALADRLGAATTCRVCERVALWERHVLAAVVSLFEDPAGAEQYRCSDGMCVPHLAAALSAGIDPAAAEHLLRTAEEQAGRVADSLTAYVRKREHHEPPSGAEDAAPHTAIEKLVGGRDRAR